MKVHWIKLVASAILIASVSAAASHLVTRRVLGVGAASSSGGWTDLADRSDSEGRRFAEETFIDENKDGNCEVAMLRAWAQKLGFDSHVACCCFLYDLNDDRTPDGLFFSTRGWTGEHKDAMFLLQDRDEDGNPDTWSVRLRDSHGSDAWRYDDLNMDGQWELKYEYESDQMHLFFEGRWFDTAKVGENWLKSATILLDGQEVELAFKDGAWTPVSEEKPGSGGERGAPE